MDSQFHWKMSSLSNVQAEEKWNSLLSQEFSMEIQSDTHLLCWELADPQQLFLVDRGHEYKTSKAKLVNRHLKFPSWGHKSVTNDVCQSFPKIKATKKRICLGRKLKSQIHFTVNDKNRNLGLSDHLQRCQWCAWPDWFTIALTTFEVDNGQWP